MLQILVVLLGVAIGRQLIQKYFPTLSLTTLDRLLVLCTLVTIVISAVSTYNYEYRLDVIQYYSEASRYNALGLTGNVGLGLTETTAISKLIDGYTYLDGNYVKIKSCMLDGLEKFKEIINKYPFYPFGYYFEAVCLQYNKNSDWRQYAQKALSIFEKTTTIDGHNPGQDYALKDLKMGLSDNATTTLFQSVRF